MSSGKSSATSSSELPEWMQPYAKSYLGKAQSVSDKPYTPYGEQTVAGMDPRTQQGIDQQAQLGANGTAIGNAGKAGLTDVLGGKYLNVDSNPYLSKQIDAAQGDVIRNYNTVSKPAMESAMVGSGSFGNSGLAQMQQGQQQDLQKSLGNISTQMRGNAYNTERGYQQQALNLAPAYSGMEFGNAQALQDAGQTQQSQQQTELTDAYQKWMQAQGYDANQLGVMGNALGTLRGNGTQTTTGNDGGSSKAQTATSLAMIAASIWSDKRLKTDIKKIGKTDDDLNIYTYRYKAGGPVQMGVMAQEVEKERPEAVTRIGGMRAVNYGLLGA